MKIGIIGLNGRMGKEIATRIISHSKCSLSGATVRPNHQYLDIDIGQILSKNNYGIKATSDIFRLAEISDVLIEFTSPEGTKEIANIANTTNTPLISGTTGINDLDISYLEKLTTSFPLLWSPNMSVGINLMAKLCEIITANLDESFDTEIIESHHKNKLDSPSGAALMLGKTIASYKKLNFEEVAVFDRLTKQEKRLPNQIGFSSIRAGDIKGEHNIMWVNDQEMLEISHKAYNRSIFADGAIKAAFWILNKKTGFYSMRDMLGL